MDTQQQSFVLVSDKPKVGELINEFKRCGSQGDHFGRMLRAEDVRLARWDGQSEDAKKHAADQREGTEVFPWEGASDIRNYQADSAVNETVAMLYMAFWNAVLKISGASPNDVSDSATATTYLDWMVHFQMLRQLDTEVELSAQFMQSIGVAGLHVTWDREVGRKMVTIKMEQLMGMQQMIKQAGQMAQQSGQPIPPELAQLGEVLSVLPNLIANPEMEKDAIQAIQYVYDMYLRKNLPEELTEDDLLMLSDKTARQAVRDLREDGDAEMPMPYLCRNQPKISALKPYRDFIMPTESGEIQTSPVVFVRELMTEVDLKKLVLSDGWDPAWVDLAVKTKGKFSTWQLNNPYSAYGTWSWRAVDNRSWLIEVVWAHYKQVDEDGVTQVQYTVFNPHVTTDEKAEPLAGKHGILNYPKPEYPVIIGRRERFDRSWLATRGLPEILATSQNVEKAMLDSVVDLASISVVPPLNVPKGMSTRYKIGPAVQNDFVPGREAHFMEMPTRGMVPAEAIVKILQEKVARYAGLFHVELPPQLAAIMQQPMVKKFLIMWGEALQMAYEMTVKFAPEQIEKVTGTAPGPDPDGFHYVMSFDSAQFHPDLMDAKMKAFTALTMEDSEGVLDRSAMTMMKARMIDPALAKELVVDRGQAGKKIYKDVMNDILNMFAGTEAVYDDASNDPAAQMKAQYAQQIIQGNPNYTAALDPALAQQLFGQQAQLMMAQAQQSGAKPNPRFSELLANYFKNLQQGVNQQQNKQIGRTGVKQIGNQMGMQ